MPYARLLEHGSPRAPQLRIVAEASRMTAFLEDMMRRLEETVASVGGWSQLEAIVARARGLRYDAHHPRPLCIDGSNYHQRRRHRRRTR